MRKKERENAKLLKTYRKSKREKEELQQLADKLAAKFPKWKKIVTMNYLGLCLNDAMKKVKDLKWEASKLGRSYEDVNQELAEMCNVLNF